MCAIVPRSRLAKHGQVAAKEAFWPHRRKELALGRGHDPMSPARALNDQDEAASGSSPIYVYLATGADPNELVVKCDTIDGLFGKSFIEVHGNIIACIFVEKQPSAFGTKAETFS